MKRRPAHLGLWIKCVCTFFLSQNLCFYTDCGALTKPAHGTVSFTGTTFKETANISCATGYTLIGSGSIVCNSSAMWDSSEYRCQPIGMIVCRFQN